jgi:curli production assembly/transport component CsgG
MKTQQIIIKKITIIITLLAVVTAGGCVTYLEPLKTKPATLGTVTQVNKELTSLPAPKEKIVAAVYKFRDQTGQYKLTTTGSTFSTAVTQGATSILLRALEQSGWFVAIEREGLSNLLNERKIIRSSRATYEGQAGQEQTLLPPLLFAGIILEGGIISYDSNVLTGGAGVKYFGAGASGQYRQDRITIYLRAISTSNGRILKTVYTSKTILSQMVDVGLFRFVEPKRLLEVESGYSYNEPTEICVTEAIEKAVQSMIIEGALDGLWEFSNPDDINSPVVKSYLQEKSVSERTDEFDELLLDKRTVGVGFNVGGQQYFGDYANGKIRPLVEIFARQSYTDALLLGAKIGTGQLTDNTLFDSRLIYAGLYGIFNMMPLYQITPFIYGGVDIAYVTTEDRYGKKVDLQSNWVPLLVAGGGVEYRIEDLFGINAQVDYNYLLSDGIDDMVRGDLYDYFWAARVGITIYPEF